MTRYLLDTNVISDAPKAAPSPFLMAWLDDRDDGFDTIIAAIAFSNECVVVTVNERDFPGIEIVNPTRAP